MTSAARASIDGWMDERVSKSCVRICRVARNPLPPVGGRQPPPVSEKAEEEAIGRHLARNQAINFFAYKW